MDDLYDETDDDIKISDQEKAIIDLNDRLRDIEKLITMLNNNMNIVIFFLFSLSLSISISSEFSARALSFFPSLFSSTWFD